MWVNNGDDNDFFCSPVDNELCEHLENGCVPQCV